MDSERENHKACLGELDGEGVTSGRGGGDFQNTSLCQNKQPSKKDLNDLRNPLVALICRFVVKYFDVRWEGIFGHP